MTKTTNYLTCVVCRHNGVVIDGEKIYCVICGADYGDDEHNTDTVYVRALPQQNIMDEAIYIEALTDGAGAIR